MNKTITVSTEYVRSVDELLNLQQRYFEASAKAKKTKLGADFQEAKDLLRACKEEEYKLRATTSAYLREIYGAMSPQDAIAAMKASLSEREEVKHG